MDRLNEGREVQQNSAKFMNFIIQDLLDFAQIKEGKFRKNLQVFNIRNSIEKVMCIQKQKAIDKHIEFKVRYLNISENN